MRIDLRYGRGETSAELSSSPRVLAPAESGAAPLDVDAIATRLDAAGLAKHAAAAERIALVVNDQTRKAGMRLVLDAVARLFERAAIAPDRVSLVIAYGLHARQGDDVSRTIYGDAILARSASLVHHDARDPSGLARVGTLASGHSLSVARAVAEADLRVLVGGVGFHYYAGFSGGRKAILPGVADEASIVRNHLRVLDANGPGGRAASCGPARLQGNPVSDEMFEGARLLDAHGGASFLANAIIGASGATAGQVIELAAGGDVEAAFRRGCDTLVQRCAVPLDRDAPLDALVASAGGWPYDASLYQAHKAYDNAFRALAPVIAKGARPTLIFVARCDEGLGHGRFAAWLEHPTRGDHYEALRARYEIVGQTSLAVRDKAAATRTIAVTDLDDAICARLGWERAASLDEALARASTHETRRWGVMPSAAQVLPLAVDS